MPKASANVTAWVRNYAVLAVLITVMFTGLALYAICGRGQARKVHVDGHAVKVRIAQTEEQKRKGLSGARQLSSSSGLLFLIANERGCIWMKDMRFSIDVLWFGPGGRLVDMQKNLSPQTYPESFCPDAQARYILEVPAGFADDKNLHEGISQIVL
jgi:uncharacterized membrane protein (UPF0127 family)